MSLWMILILMGFVILISYKPEQGTIHKRFLPPDATSQTQDPLRWKPTSGINDPVGAIFSQ
jgi:hypothetical protein